MKRTGFAGIFAFRTPMDELYLTLIIETNSGCTRPRCPRLIAVARDKKVLCLRRARGKPLAGSARP